MCVVNNDLFALLIMMPLILAAAGWSSPLHIPLNLLCVCMDSFELELLTTSKKLAHIPPPLSGARWENDLLEYDSGEIFIYNINIELSIV